MAENQRGQLKIRDWPTWLNWYQRTILLGLSVLVVSILRPANLSAFVIIDIPMSPGPAAIRPQSQPPEAFSIPPSVGEDLQQVSVIFRCFNPLTGELIPDVIIDIKVDAVKATEGTSTRIQTAQLGHENLSRVVQGQEARDCQPPIRPRKYQGRCRTESDVLNPDLWMSHRELTLRLGFAWKCPFPVYQRADSGL